MLFASVPRLAWIPSRPICLATASAAGSAILPTDQSQAPILNRRGAFAAIAAAERVKAPFQLATCGWVLGPQQDRALFDKVLPKNVGASCINREVGKTPVDRAFTEVSNRSKWAIPWLEDDPGLTGPQLWAGRMRRDAADALRYGCDGLMGIHWRTRILSPNVSALAQAAWEQGEWSNPPTQTAEPPRVAGAVG